MLCGRSWNLQCGGHPEESMDLSICSRCLSDYNCVWIALDKSCFTGWGKKPPFICIEMQIQVALPNVHVLLLTQVMVLCKSTCPVCMSNTLALAQPPNLSKTDKLGLGWTICPNCQAIWSSYLILFPLNDFRLASPIPLLERFPYETRQSSEHTIVPFRPKTCRGGTGCGTTSNT